MPRTAAPATRPWQVEHEANVTTVRMKAKDTRWEQWFLLRSDAHHDSPHCRRDIEERDLKRAMERNAGILDFGDLFDAMCGKLDKRSSKDSLREEYKSGDYLDQLVHHAAKRYTPYAPNWILMAQGNHETGVLAKLETNLSARLVERLNDRTGSAIVAGGYTGWVVFQVDRCGHRDRRTLWYTHGYGGGAPVTADMIQTQRQAVYIDADLFVSGHVHRGWHRPEVRLRVNQHGAVEKRPMHWIKVPTYKDEYGHGLGGFGVEKGHGPRVLGAVWLRLWLDGNGGLHEDVIVDAHQTS
jgi:hypothetical protein